MSSVTLVLNHILFSIFCLTMIGCEDSSIALNAAQNKSQEMLKMKLCAEFRTDTPIRKEFIQFLKEDDIFKNGKLLIEPQEVDFKSENPEYYLFFVDTTTAYGNLLQSFWVEPEAKMFDDYVEAYLTEHYPHYKDCSGYIKASTSRFDF